MKFNLTAVLDEETRKQFKAELHGLVKALTREEVTVTIKAELDRKVNAWFAKLADDTYHSRSIIEGALRNVLNTNWDGMSAKLKGVISEVIKDGYHDMVAAQVYKETEVVVAKKLRDKTVWEASAQDDYVRRVVRDELRKALAGLRT